jgi:hypothetical protein|tara:strand:+ start:1205 stop:1618 length:414 start_codon:yes stop_codon:yes gene_type:complete
MLLDKEIQKLKWKLFNTIYRLRNKYNKSIKRKMYWYRTDWERKIKVLGDNVVEKLNDEIEWINGLSRKEFCMMFGKKPKVQFNKSSVSKGMRNYRYSKYRGGFPKELKPNCWKDKHLEDKRKFKIKVGVENKGTPIG